MDLEVGRVKQGWLADLLLVDGDPTQDVSILQDVDSHIGNAPPGDDMTVLVDYFGREVTDALAGETTYEYDEVGNRILERDAEGRETKLEYDAVGQLTARVRPLGQREEFTYDAAGNRTSPPSPRPTEQCCGPTIGVGTHTGTRPSRRPIWRRSPFMIYDTPTRAWPESPGPT